MKRDNPTIQQQFADLKRGLSLMSDEEWASIPDVGDLTRKNIKKSRNTMNSRLGERYSAVPESILLSNLKSTILENSLTTQDSQNGHDSKESKDSNESQDSTTDFIQFGKARDRMLGMKLDQIGDSVSGTTTIDPKGYLTDLSGINLKSDTEISDIKKAKTLLKSVTMTNPKHAPGWIAAARLEEFAGKMSAARDIICKGCEECPKSEDVWLEAARLHSNESAQVILANAIRHVPQSVKIWSKAAELESDVTSKKRVTRRALEFIPNSVKLWKSAISLESDPQDARILLSRAVECVPLSVELWLALARLESYENAKKVLNKARTSIPTSHEIWISAAKLEESQGNSKMVDTIIARAVIVLAQKGSPLDRESWILQAQECEKEGALLSCQCIIQHTIGLGLEEEEESDKWQIWMDDAENCTKLNSFETARAIYTVSVDTYPTQESLWIQWAYFEKENGTKDSLDSVLARGVDVCPETEVLWLMRAKEKWLSNDISMAKRILESAFAANPNSEQIWLAAIKLEIETQEFSRAQLLLESARKQANTPRVWMKSVLLYRQLKQFDQAFSLLDESLILFPHFPKLWMIKGQLQEQLQTLENAKSTYTKGLALNPKCIPLWILSCQLEEKSGSPIKARAVLEKARFMNPKVPELWLEAVRVELRAQNLPMAKALLAKALQECPSSGLLWSEAILLEPRPARKSKSTDALKKCENDALVVMTIARLFWFERKYEKARNWFHRAAKTNPDLGDVWAWWLKFEMMHGDSSQVDFVIQKCNEADPKHGEKWISVSKNVNNSVKSTKDIVMMVAAELNNEF